MFCRASIKIFWLYVSIVSFINICVYGATSSQIAAALDNPAGIVFASSNDWQVLNGTIQIPGTRGIPVAGQSYLRASVPLAPGNPQVKRSISFVVKGSGNLVFRCQTSVDTWNGAGLFYSDGAQSEASFIHGYYWVPASFLHWEDWWWEEQYISLGTATYTHNVTISLRGASTDLEYFPPTLYNGETIYSMAWLDKFVWEENDQAKILRFFPDPEFQSSFDSETNVGLYSDYGNIYFYYTTDGSVPSNKSTVFDPYEGIELSKTSTISAIAYENGQKVSDKIYTATYFLMSPVPSFELSQDDFADQATVSLVSEAPAAQFFYTINGQEPVHKAGQAQPGTEKGNSITISEPTSIRALTWQPNFANSYTARYNFERAAAPKASFEIDGESSTHLYFDDGARVKLTSAPGSIIKYQIDSGEICVYEEEEIDVKQSSLIRFQAQQEGKLHSEIVELRLTMPSDDYTIEVPSSSGWHLFFLPGEIGLKTSASLISELQPFALDSDKKTYYRPKLLLAGESYWFFCKAGDNFENLDADIKIDRASASFVLPAQKWLLSVDNGNLPDTVQAWLWENQTFNLGKSQNPPNSAWLYNNSNSSITIDLDEEP